MELSNHNLVESKVLRQWFMKLGISAVLFGNWVCFRLQVSGRRRIISGILTEELTSFTGQPASCNKGYIRA
jgi:hypothetical protein